MTLGEKRNTFNSVYWTKIGTRLFLITSNQERFSESNTQIQNLIEITSGYTQVFLLWNATYDFIKVLGTAVVVLSKEHFTYERGKQNLP